LESAGGRQAACLQQAHLCGFLTPPVAGADLRAALVASCLRGALPPVDLRAVCFVRAMAAVGDRRSVDEFFSLACCFERSL